MDCKRVLTFWFTLLLAAGCARTDADSSHAEIIASPAAGYTCFAIKNGAGDTVGGNCVRSN